ncbi:MAG: nitrate/nitrite transporter NrtS [Colwellia sp.]
MNMYIKAFSVAIIVGSILLCINQFDALFGQSEIRLIPALLTYCVPFIVFLLGNRQGIKTKNKGN